MWLLYRTIEYLFKKKWLDGYTRTIFVEFTVYNANVNLFCIVTLLLETNAIGEDERLLAELQDDTVVTGLTALAALLKETCFCWRCRSIPVCQQSADCATVPVNRWPPCLCHGCWDHIHGFHPVLHVHTGKQTQKRFQLPHLLNFLMYAY